MTGDLHVHFEARAETSPSSGDAAVSHLDETFSSLFALPGAGTGRLPDAAEEPAYFPDLQLDLLVDAVVTGREKFNLAPAFRARLEDVSAIERRQGVFADLADERLHAAIQAFCDGLARCERLLELASRSRHERQSQLLRLNAIASYAEVIETVDRALEQVGPSSAGMRAWMGWLAEYRASQDFVFLVTGAQRLVTELSDLHYTLAISGPKVVAKPFAEQEDLSAATLATFERFRGEEDPAPRPSSRAGAELHFLQMAVLDLVVQLFPEFFERVSTFLREHSKVQHETIATVERELQFALSWLAFLAPLQQAGLAFCLPAVRAGDQRLAAVDTFDALLAHELIKADQVPVTNDVALDGGEQVLVVTGPNQGGKTTFARTLGQLYHLTGVGLPVPGRSATVQPAVSILTHFEGADRPDDLTSRLEDEVKRMAELLNEVRPGALVILNEMFSSTTWIDAREMSERVLHAVLDADAVCVCVTFIDELSQLGPRVVSLVSGIDGSDTTQRTFKILRGQADGKAYALALASKYALTRDQLQARIEAHA